MSSQWWDGRVQATTTIWYLCDEHVKKLHYSCPFHHNATLLESAWRNCPRVHNCHFPAKTTQWRLIHYLSVVHNHTFLALAVVVVQEYIVGSCWYCSTTEGSDCVVSVRGICSLMLNLFTRRVWLLFHCYDYTKSCNVCYCTVIILWAHTSAVCNTAHMESNVQYTHKTSIYTTRQD